MKGIQGGEVDRDEVEARGRKGGTKSGKEKDEDVKGCQECARGTLMKTKVG